MAQLIVMIHMLGPQNQPQSLIICVSEVIRTHFTDWFIFSTHYPLLPQPPSCTCFAQWHPQPVCLLLRWWLKGRRSPWFICLLYPQVDRVRPALTSWLPNLENMSINSISFWINVFHNRILKSNTGIRSTRRLEMHIDGLQRESSCPSV